jgi:hypothetical protein
MGITVTPRMGDSGPAQIDSIDGSRLDFAREWTRYFSSGPSNTDIRARRYWDTADLQRHREPGSPHYWTRLEVRYGPTGVPGDVVDTTIGRSTAAVGVDDATTHNYRHLLLRPKGARIALLAAEVIGRSRPVSKLLAAVRDDFQSQHPDFWVDYEVLADGQYWASFLENADLVALNVTRHREIPGYLDTDGDGATLVATMKTRIEAAGRGRRLPRQLIPGLLNRDVSPEQAFGLDFVPDTVSLVLEADGTQKTIVLDAGEQPVFVYPIGQEDRRDRPPTREFLDEVQPTLLRLLATFPD